MATEHTDGAQAQPFIVGFSLFVTLVYLPFSVPTVLAQSVEEYTKLGLAVALPVGVILSCVLRWSRGAGVDSYVWILCGASAISLFFWIVLRLV